jgi:enoyl-CoA hydratase/carnithine racemase
MGAGKGFDEPEKKPEHILSELMPDEERMNDVRSEAAKLAADAMKERGPKPKFELPGPLKPPAAPATYKALTKLRLRVAPSRWSDILTSKTIEADTLFRVLEERPDSDNPEISFLRADAEFDDGWLLDSGVAGEWAGKKTIQRVAGSMKKAEVSVNQISAVEDAEVSSSGQGYEGAERTPAEAAALQKEALKSALQDPALLEMMAKAGVDVDALKDNPDFTEGVARDLYGEELVK